MIYVRLHADDDGVSHFDDVHVAFSFTDFAPPAPPLEVSPTETATEVFFLRFPPGWRGDWHRAPRRQYQYFLSGRLDAEASDGEIRSFGPGSAALVEDNAGQGHRTWVAGDEPVLVAVVRIVQ